MLYIQLWWVVRQMGKVWKSIFGGLIILGLDGFLEEVTFELLYYYCNVIEEFSLNKCLRKYWNKGFGGIFGGSVVKTLLPVQKAWVSILGQGTKLQHVAWCGQKKKKLRFNNKHGNIIFFFYINLCSILVLVYHLQNSLEIVDFLHWLPQFLDVLVWV